MTFRRQTTGIVRTGGTATVVDASSYRTGPASTETPELRRSAAEPWEIVIPSFVRETMADDAWTRARSDGHEVGGFLFAETPRESERSVRLFHATETANAVRTADAMTLDADEWRRAEAWLERNEWNDTRLIGLWHSHPSAAERTPSTTDLRAFLGALDHSGTVGRAAPVSVALILTPQWDGYWGVSSWGRPEIYGWVTRREWGRPVTEPASVRCV